MANSADTNSSLSISELEAVLVMFGDNKEVIRNIRTGYTNDDQYRVYLEAIIELRVQQNDDTGT